MSRRTTHDAIHNLVLNRTFFVNLWCSTLSPLLSAYSCFRKQACDPMTYVFHGHMFLKEYALKVLDCFFSVFFLFFLFHFCIWIYSLFLFLCFLGFFGLLQICLGFYWASQHRGCIFAWLQVFVTETQYVSMLINDKCMMLSSPSGSWWSNHLGMLW